MAHGHLHLALAEAVATQLAEEYNVRASSEAIADFFAHRAFPDDTFWSAWDSNVGEMTDFYREHGKNTP